MVAGGWYSLVIVIVMATRTRGTAALSLREEERWMEGEAKGKGTDIMEKVEG